MRRKTQILKNYQFLTYFSFIFRNLKIQHNHISFQILFHILYEKQNIIFFLIFRNILYLNLQIHKVVICKPLIFWEVTKKWDKPIKQVMFCQFEYQIDDNLKTRTYIIQVSNMIKSCHKWLIRHQKCLQIKLTVNFLFLLPCVLHQKYGKKDRPIIIVVTVLPYLHHIFICII